MKDDVELPHADTAAIPAEMPDTASTTIIAARIAELHVSSWARRLPTRVVSTLKRVPPSRTFHPTMSDGRYAPLYSAKSGRVHYRVIVLGGELAVPCTRNPLQRGVIPRSRPRAAAPADRSDVDSRVLRGEAL